MADYAEFVSRGRLERLEGLADGLGDTRVLHVNSTAVGGGVAELLRSLVPLFDDLGVDTDWLVMEADEPFFEVTKTLHNGLQGQDLALTDGMKATYRSVTEENAAALAEEYDVVVLHDTQPLGMAETLSDRFPDTRLVWRCHIDLTSTTRSHLEFVADHASRVDHAIFSHPAYEPGIDGLPSTIIHPSIDPLTDKNRPLDRTEAEVERDRLESIPFGDSPVVTQVSRFDPWKDPIGVVEAYRRVNERHPETELVLAGGMADDDPEGVEVYERVVEEAANDPGVHLLTDEPDTTINFLQRRSNVVLQKSLREGFGLVVSEALWKRTPVVGSNVGGIPLQINDGENGYLVEPDDVDAVAERIERLLADDELGRKLGDRGRETVRERFLLPRHLLDYLELLAEVR